MRTSLYTCVALTVAAAVLPAASAHAQSISSAYTYLEERQELGVFWGRMGANTGRFGYGPKGGNLYGVRYGIELSGPLSFEGVWQWMDGDRTVIDPGRVEGDRAIGTADGSVTTLEARLKFSFSGRRAWHRLSPFLTFGGGIAIDAASSSELDDILLPQDVFEFGNSFFGTVAAGARWYVTDHFTLRGDGVFSLWKIDTPPGYSDPDRGFDRVADGEWLGGTAFTVALLYRW